MFQFNFHISRGLLLGLLFLLPYSLIAGKTGYHLKFKVKGEIDSVAYLGYYYGNKQYLKDTVEIQKNGSFEFKGDTVLKGGIYLIIFPPKNTYFEIVIGNEQHFSIETDLDDVVDQMNIVGSVNNLVFYDYMRFIRARRGEADSLKLVLDSMDLVKDSAGIRILQKRLGELDKDVKTYMKSVIDANKGIFYTKVLKAMLEPEIPDPPISPDGTTDSLFEYKFYKHHFFDNIDFTDDRIIRTPIYHKKIEKYLQRLTLKHPDSIIYASDVLLSKTIVNDEIFRYTLIYLLNYYAKDKIMGMDAVYVHLVEEYYMNDHAWWIDSVQLYKLTTRAMILKPILIGKKVPELNLSNEKGKTMSLHEIEAEYVILCFWDPDCGHCKKEIPYLHQVYLRLKSQGVAAYAVCTEVEIDKWKKFIEDYELDWINVADPYFRSNVRDKFDIVVTPKIFLLDKDKTIIAKRIAADQVEQFLERLLN